MIHRFASPDGPSSDGPGFHDFRSDVEREYPLAQIHDMESPDIRTALAMGAEVCNLTGAEILVHQRTDNYADDVWDEDPDPTYWPAVTMKGFFAPGTIEVLLKLWGSDAEVKLDIYFSVKTALEKLGERVFRHGDVLLVPFNAIGNIKPRYFRVLNVTPIGNHRYSWIYLQCKCASLTGDITVMPRDGSTNQIADYNER